MKTIIRIMPTLAMLLVLLLSPHAQAQQVYEARFFPKLPGNNPLAWDQQQRIGQLKEVAQDNRMVKYGVEAASQLTNDSVLRTLDQSASADPTRPTSFMVAGDSKGCYFHIRSVDPDIAQAVAAGKSQTLEIFLATHAPGDTGYFRIEVNIVTGQWYATNYHGQSQGYPPLDRHLTVRTEILPTGQAWGTVLFIPWEYLHNQLPFDGQVWSLTFMRWSPTGGVTWGGKVHEQGAWGQIKWTPPTEEQRQAIQAGIIQKAWKQYQDQAAAAKRYWLTLENDPSFYTSKIEPLVQRLNAPVQQTRDAKAASTLDSHDVTHVAGAAPTTVKEVDLAKLDASQTARLYAHVADWVSFDQQVEHLRRDHLQQRLMGEHSSAPACR